MGEKGGHLLGLLRGHALALVSIIDTIASYCGWERKCLHAGVTSSVNFL